MGAKRNSLNIPPTAAAAAVAEAVEARIIRLGQRYSNRDWTNPPEFQ